MEKPTYTKLDGRLIKQKDMPAMIQNGKVFKQMMDMLEPGIYDIKIIPLVSRLERLKHRYFAMESELGRHLGMKKVEIHKALKYYIGHHINKDTGKEEYLSIAKMEKEEDMEVRIQELSEYAATEFNYTFPPPEETLY